jgi:hypothetical protein
VVVVDRHADEGSSGSQVGFTPNEGIANQIGPAPDDTPRGQSVGFASQGLDRAARGVVGEGRRVCGRFTQQRPTSELAQIFEAEDRVAAPGQVP